MSLTGSVSLGPWLPAVRCRVAGVQAPAFVERLCRVKVRTPDSRRVAGVQAPAFVERSGGASTHSAPCRVSPEFRLRPSLSEARVGRAHGTHSRVAGVQAPAFVERSSGSGHASVRSGVSPEFRLRPSLSVVDPAVLDPHHARVSPEFRLRPSLSVLNAPRTAAREYRVSPEFRLRPSLSARPGERRHFAR